ncbi:MAG: hypothetical protein GXP27_04325 [Planctomycetes bacterium]|nr:hypothetical protein [Planctomycetota bacterium]
MNPANSKKFIRVDRTDFDFRKGYFFEMLVDRRTSITGQIQDESRIGDVGRCSQHRTCRKYLIWRPLVVQLYMPPKDIFQCSDETQSALVVSDRLLKALKQARYHGVSSGAGGGY